MDADATVTTDVEAKLTTAWWHRQRFPRRADRSMLLWESRLREKTI